VFARDAIDHAAAHERFPDRAVRPPFRPVRQQIVDRDGEVIVRLHQAGGRCDDAVPIRIRVIGECEAILVLQADKPRHRVGARTIHPDLAVMIDCHERKRGVEHRVDDGNVQSVDVINRRPIGL